MRGYSYRYSHIYIYMHYCTYVHLGEEELIAGHRNFEKKSKKTETCKRE